MPNPILPYATALLIGKQREAFYRRRQRLSSGKFEVFVSAKGLSDALMIDALVRLSHSSSTTPLQPVIRLCPEPLLPENRLGELQKRWQITSAKRWQDYWSLSPGSLTELDRFEMDHNQAENLDRLRRYGGGDLPSIRFGGELFRGLERIPLLIRRLQDAGQTVASLFSLPALGAPSQLLPLYFSFRSPYSYLAVARIHQANLTSSFCPIPVPPMVTRGVALPRWKKMYIVWDASRLARMYGIPFGRIADPLGEPARRCMRVTHWLEKKFQDLTWQFILSAMRAIWAEGIYLGRNRSFQNITERAGLTWAEVRDEFERPSHDIALNHNATKLLDAGHWGVPTTILDGTPFWGQDQLGFVAANVRPKKDCHATS